MAGPQSAAVASSTVQEDNSISFLDVLQMLLENLRLLVLLPLAVGLLALGYSFTITPTFTAVTRVMPPQQSGVSSASLINSIAGFAVNRNPLDQYVTLAKSDSVRFALVDRFKLMERYGTKGKEDARNVLDDVIRVTGNGKDAVITIAAEDHDPAFAAGLANANVEELNHLLQRLSITEAQKRRVFFEQQMLHAKDALIKAEQELKTSSVGSDALKANPSVAVVELAKIKAGITAQELKLASMRGYLAPSAPEFKQAQIELSAMRTQLARAEERQPADNKGGGDYIAKYREFKYRESLVDLFTKQYETARVDESSEGSVIQVVDIAHIPEHKSKPQKVLITLVAIVLSGFASLLFVLVRYALRRAGQDADVSRKFLNLRKSFARALGIS
jgi:tyrosine-protein kinase Etk/Wzc